VEGGFLEIKDFYDKYKPKELIFHKAGNRISFGSGAGNRKYKNFQKDFDKSYYLYTDLSCEDLFKAIGGKTKKAEDK